VADERENPNTAPDEPALACALPHDVLAERRVAIEALLRARTAARLCPDGVELSFVFSEAIAQVLLEFIVYEQACCKSFTYLLCFAPPHNAVTLRLQAPEEQVKLLQDFYTHLLP
jgi:hypothetical protein